jgi:glycosyltransferase involved in cell wall biosynthesis
MLKNDSRILVLHKKNGGLSDARNTGLENILGEYVIFIDSDDYMDHNLVEDAIHNSLDSKADVTIWGFYVDFLDENEKLISSKINQPKSGTFSKNNISDLTLTAKTIGVLGYAWNKMYKKELLQNNNFRFTKGLSLVEDMVFNGQVLAKAERIAFIEKPYIHYIQRPRETLGVKLYENYYELIEMAMNAVESLLIEWKKNEQEISLIKGQMLYNSLKSNIRLLSNAKNLSNKDKRSYLKTLLKNRNLQSNLLNHSPQNIKDMIIKFLIQKQKTDFLLVLYDKK